MKKISFVLSFLICLLLCSCGSSTPKSAELTEKYDFYKEGRSATPDELKMQMPIARDILTAMGIKYLELAPYEADDIIGTLAHMADEDPEVYATIVSSDRDLLQLISPVVDVKLLKQKDYIRAKSLSKSIMLSLLA